MTRAVQAFGYRVVAAEDGAAAWELLQRAPGSIQAVIADMLMPKLGGVELARRIDTLAGGPPVGFVSGSVQPEAARGRPFLTKPFTLPELAAMVSQLLGARPVEREGPTPLQRGRA